MDDSEASPEDAPVAKPLTHKVLESFVGKAPLVKAQPHFETRDALFRAYADFLSKTFRPTAPKDAKCDLCERRDLPAAWLRVDWAGRIRWHPKQLALLVVVMAIAVPLHLPWVAGWMLARLDLEESVYFRTVHPLCQSCLWRLRFRRTMNFVLRFLGGFLGTIGGIVALISGVYIVAGLTGIWQLNRHDILWGTQFFVPAAVLCVIAYAIVRFANWRVRYPANVRRLVKRPFHAKEMAVAKSAADGSYANVDLDWEWLR